MEAAFAAGVLAFMLALLFCRSLIECTHAALKLAGAAVDACVGCAGCGGCALHYGDRESARQVVLALLVAWGVGKPLALLLAPLAAEWAAGSAPRWTVVFAAVTLNASAVGAAANGTGELCAGCATVDAQRADGLTLAMPFALLSATSTWVWVTLKNEGFFDADQGWDEELFAHRGMQVYEVLYALEVLALLFALLCLAGEPVAAEDAALAAVCLTLTLFYFFACSRSSGAGPGDSVFASVLVGVLGLVSTGFVLAHPRRCWVQQSGAAALLLALVALALAHTAGGSERAAGEVILVRTVASGAAGLYFTALAVADRDAQCRGALY